MKTWKFISLITLWVTAICITAMFATYLSDHLQETNWFGDYQEFYSDGSKKPFLTTSARHSWYYAACTILFLGNIAQVFNVWSKYMKNQETNP